MGTVSKRATELRKYGASLLWLALLLTLSAMGSQAQTAFAWGNSDYGQLGGDSTDYEATPSQVFGPGGTGFLSGFTAVAAGYLHSLALKSDGTVWAWGDNVDGELGVSTNTNTNKPNPTPVQVVGPGDTGFLMGITAIAAGGDNSYFSDTYGFSLALKSDNTVWAWGSNYYGQLGHTLGTDGDVADYYNPVPTQVQGHNGIGYLSNIVAISAGNQHCLARDKNDNVWAWGHNQYGELGNNTTVDNATPVEVVQPNLVGHLTAAAISAGYQFSVALKADGSVWTWGYNADGELGNGMTTNSSVPVQVVGPGGTGFLTGIMAISAKGDHTLALRNDGTVWAWGSNSNGQLGNNMTTSSSTPVQVLGIGGTGFLTGITQIAAGYYHSLALTLDGTAVAWGFNGGYNDNDGGELGDNSVAESNTPVQVIGEYGNTAALTSILQLSAGGYHSLALVKVTPILTPSPGHGVSPPGGKQKAPLP